MAPSEGERLAVVETEVRGLRDDVQALTVEQERTRQRLHSLEGTVQGVVKTAAGRAEEAARSAARTQRWVQILTFVVAFAAVVVSIIVAVHGGHTH